MSKAQLKALTGNDTQAIADLLKEDFREGYSEEYWAKRLNHWFTENPNWQADDIIGHGIFLRDEIVGVLLSIPTKMILSDQSIVVRNLSTWYILKKARGYSLDLLKLAISEKDTVFFSTSVLKELCKVTEFVGFKKYIARDKILAKAIVINPANAAFYKLFGKRLTSIDFIAKGWTKLTLRSVKKEEIQISTSIDLKKHDEFWKTAKAKRGEYFTNDRSSASIDWLLNNPVTDIKYVAIQNNDGKMQGFLLFRLIKKEVFALECIDSYFIENGAELFYDNLKKINKVVVKSISKNSPDIVLFPDICGLEIDRIKGVKIERQDYNNKFALSTREDVSQSINNLKFYLTNQGDTNL